jgi:hypothetical protein
MHKHLIVLVSVLVLAATSTTSALAGWGCAARDRAGYWGNSWGALTQANARRIALGLCRHAGGRACHIIGCNPNIDTSNQADTTWPPPNPPTVACGPGQIKCLGR